MDARSEPPRLAANPRLPAEIALESARRCDFAISGGGSAPFAINGATFVDWAPKPAYVIPRGQPAVFALANKTAVVQALRLWGHVARLLHSMDDGWEPYWRDTILIQPGRTAHVAFVADNPGKWPLESAIPEHRASRSGSLVSGGCNNGFKRPPGNDGLANRRRPPRAGKEWWRTLFRSPSRRTAAPSYSCRKSRSRRPEAAAGS